MPASDLTWVRAETKQMVDTIWNAWRIEDGAFHLDVTIPANTTATAYLPSGTYRFACSK